MEVVAVCNKLVGARARKKKNHHWSTSPFWMEHYEELKKRREMMRNKQNAKVWLLKKLLDKAVGEGCLRQKAVRLKVSTICWWSLTFAKRPWFYLSIHPSAICISTPAMLFVHVGTYRTPSSSNNLMHFYPTFKVCIVYRAIKSSLFYLRLPVAQLLLQTARRVFRWNSIKVQISAALIEKSWKISIQIQVTVSLWSNGNLKKILWPW